MSVGETSLRGGAIARARARLEEGDARAGVDGDRLEALLLEEPVHELLFLRAADLLDAHLHLRRGDA